MKYFVITHLLLELDSCGDFLAGTKKKYSCSESLPTLLLPSLLWPCHNWHLKWPLQTQVLMADNQHSLWCYCEVVEP
jgi:hypothetical protein